MNKQREDLIGSLIPDVARLLRLEIDRRVKAHGLTQVKWLALGVIEQDPGMTQRQLAQRLEIGVAATGRLIDRLQARGLVRREPAPNDRRAFRLALTRKAEAILAELDGAADSLRDELLDGLSSRQVAVVREGLSRLKANLQRTAAAVVVAILARLDEFEVAAGLASPAFQIT